MNINELIIKSFSTTLSKPENEALNSWLSENNENKEVYLKLKQLHTLGQIRITHITKKEKDSISSAKKNIFKNISRSQYKNNFIKYAAVFIGFILISGGGYFSIKQYHKNTSISENQSETINSASTRLETVIIKDGKTITLNELTPKTIIGNIAINNNSKNKVLSLNSIKENNLEKEQKFYSVVVPKGRRYVVILPDSSEVHLNSDSELKLPDFFLDTIRNIELKGEGYFKIKHNSKAPFIVNFNNRQVRVLGTEFNINAYDTVNNQITLTKGSVMVKSGQSSTTLTPSQQAKINGNNIIETKTVNTSDFTAWIDGKFCYSNVLLSEIVSDLCRRFNYEFKIIDKELNDIRMTIKLNENTTITDMIKAINRAGETILKAKIDIESSSILISK